MSLFSDFVHRKPFISLIPSVLMTLKRDIFSAAAFRDKSALPCNRPALLPVQLFSLHGVGPSLPEKVPCTAPRLSPTVLLVGRPARGMRSGVGRSPVAPTVFFSSYSPVPSAKAFNSAVSLFQGLTRLKRPRRTGFMSGFARVLGAQSDTNLGLIFGISK